MGDAKAKGSAGENVLAARRREKLEIGPDTLEGYLRSNTRVFTKVNDATYYVTHTDGYWRVQDCANLNDKGHFTDCSELVPTLNEVMNLPVFDGKSLVDVAADAEFYASVPE